MPTGYTAPVADGKVTDFRTFALRCARQFGACVMQRDAPMDELPRRREASRFYAEALPDAKQRLRRVQAMSAEDAIDAAQAAFATAHQVWRESQARREATRARYEAMLDQVRAWTPPSKDHRELQQFMEQQLTESIEFDCGFEAPEPQPEPWRTWLAAELARAQRDVAYYEQRMAEEDERVATSNAWIDALYESLPVEEGAQT